MREMDDRLKRQERHSSVLLSNLLEEDNEGPVNSVVKFFGGVNQALISKLEETDVKSVHRIGKPIFRKDTPPYCLPSPLPEQDGIPSRKR